MFDILFQAHAKKGTGKMKSSVFICLVFQVCFVHFDIKTNSLIAG